MKTQYILIVFIYACLYSCKNTKNDNNVITQAINSVPLMECEYRSNYEVIDINDFDVIKIPEYNNRIKDIMYVAIDSDEPIGEVYQLLVFDKKIYILDNKTEKIFIHGTDGKNIRIIDSKGGGPKEYVGLGTMCISVYDSCLIVSDRMKNSFLYYSLDGQFIKKSKGISGCFIESYGNKIFTQLDFGQSYSQEMNSNFHLVSIIEDSVIRKAFPLLPIQKNSIVKKSIFYNYEGSLLFAPLYSDTVYQFTSDSVYRPKYIVKQDKSLWDKRQKDLGIEEKFKLQRDDHYTCLDKPFLETDRFISYKIETVEKGSQFFASKSYFYDKNNKRSFLFGGGENLTSLPNLIATPIAIDHNCFVGCISSTEIENLRSIRNEYKLGVDNDDLRSILDSDTNWECVVVFYEFQ